MMVSQHIKKYGLLYLALLIGLQRIDGGIFLTENSNEWGMLSSMDGSLNGISPANADPDFYSTWHSQSFETYSGVDYNGPAFTTGHQAPFEYGGVVGVEENTVIPIPNEGTRGTAYFLKVIDGGVNGYESFAIKMLANDAAYVYLNGELISVKGTVSSDAIDDLWDSYSGTEGSETVYTSLPLLGTPKILPGPNLLAISVHQYASDSPDLGFSIILDDTMSVVRGPYLQSGSHDSLTVRWRTNMISDSVVMYGDAPNNLNQSVTLSNLVRDHEVVINGLSPATKYYYAIKSSNASSYVVVGGDSTYYFQTHPIPGEKVPTRIWVIGDSGTTSAAKDAVYNAYLAKSGAETHTDAWLMLGDNAYNRGTDDEFQAALFDAYPELLRNTIMWSCIGNHEAYTARAVPFLDIHSFPTTGAAGGVPSGTEHYYSFDYGNIHFICLDSQFPDNIFDTPGGNIGMVDWLELDLQSTDKDWIVAFFHHGPYTKGAHDSDVDWQHVRVRRYITPLLERYGVDLVLSGHNHNYERSMLINGHHSNMSTADSLSESFVEATHAVDNGNGSTLGSVDNITGAFILSGETGAYEKPMAEGEAGAIYAICGASGKLGSWNNGSTAVVHPAPHPVFAVSLRVMGSMILAVDGNSLNAQYIDSNGAIRDDFTILKGSTYEIASADNAFAEFGPDSTASFRLSRSGALSLAEDVSYELSGTATSGLDYSPSLNGSVSFPAGESHRDVILTRAADALAEGNETSQFTLSLTPQGAGTGGALRQKYFIGPRSSTSVTLQDAPSQSWWFNAFGAAELSEIDWAIDSDKDGLNRLFEYAFGGTSGLNDRDRLPQFAINGEFMELHYWKDNALTDLSYTVEAFTDLEELTPTVFTNTLEGSPNPTGEERWKGSVPVDSPMKFMRISIQNR